LDKLQFFYINLVNVSDCPTSIASKKDGNVFYHVYRRFFYFGDKKRVFDVFFLFFLTFIRPTSMVS